MRYAIYYAPEASSALWRFGSAVLGYDAVTGLDVTQHCPEGVSATDWHRLTEDPRRYGFHATLKAPFHLASGESEDHLAESVKRFAGKTNVVELGACAVHVVEEVFVAITPTTPPPALGVLERAIVTAFEPFRAPLTPEDRARRRPERLSERQRDQLDRYGYPYVFDDFRFHMTLSGRLPDPEPIAVSLQAAWAAMRDSETVTVDSIALFRQKPGERFTIVERFALTG